MFARGTARTKEKRLVMSNSKNKDFTSTNSQVVWEGAEASSFFQGAKDIMGKLEHHVIPMLFASIIASVAIFLFYDFYFPVELITQKCYDYCPMLIAFAIAIYAFFLSIEKREVKKRAEELIDKGYSVASVFSATIIWFAINSLFLIVLAVLCDISQGESTLMNILLTSFIIYVILLLFDLFEVMYGFHTFIYPEQRDIAELAIKMKKSSKKNKNLRKVRIVYLFLSPLLIALLMSLALKGNFKNLSLISNEFSYVEGLKVTILYLVYCFVIIGMISKRKKESANN